MATTECYICIENVLQEKVNENEGKININYASDQQQKNKTNNTENKYILQTSTSS